MPLRTDAVKSVLDAWTHEDLADLYDHDMECQVNVAQGLGERIASEFKSRTWTGWTDGIETWKSFRIPYKASTEPEYTDKEMTFDLTKHVEAIGMTGWDWVNRVSKWVAYDFDSLIGHSEGLSTEELDEIVEAVKLVPWVTIRRSTSGKGIHIYVFVDDVPTENHTEHAALARSILGILSAQTQYNFSNKVDTCGGNMWVWHRKMKNTNGLELIKAGTVFRDVPESWRDHVEVIQGKRRKNLPKDIKASQQTEFELLVGQRPRVDLDEDHKKLIDFLTEHNALWWWDQDNYMLVTHTHWLRRAHQELGFKGYFNTNTDATDLDEQNCFAFPLRNGVWSIRRYSQGIKEHDSWIQDGAGWTQCYLNKGPDLATASRAYGGLENSKGGFQFKEVEVATEAAALLGAHIDVGARMKQRKVTLSPHRDGRLVVGIERQAEDAIEDVPGFLAEKNQWTRIYNTQKEQTKDTDSFYGDYDDFVRHIVTSNDEDYGWMMHTDSRWRAEPLHHVKTAMKSTGLKEKEVTGILGDSIIRPWSLVNKPFQAEYPGDREWNRNAAQLRFKTLPPDTPDLQYPHWQKILYHCGEALTDSLKKDGWAQANGITEGQDYLKCWLASLFQFPERPLPYLFFYGPQNSGKSIFHEALNPLLTKGYQRADAALISQAAFNGELEGAIICVIEETDLRKQKSAYSRIKDWVTSTDLLIHAKGQTPYHVPNTTHWIQCANSHHACPVFPGDTRITVLFVDNLDPLQLIPKRRFMEELQKEAPAFLTELLRLEIPDSNDRLNVPVIDSIHKERLEEENMTPVEAFLAGYCTMTSGRMISLSAMFEKFRSTLEPDEVLAWTKQRLSRHMPPSIPKGRRRTDGQWYWGNVAWKDEDYKDEPLRHLVSVDKFLMEVE